MKSFCGYVRVSTAKQGEGVSLEVQKQAIEKYAVQNKLAISHWFEEKETAAKQGRPLFNQMLKLVRSRKVSGVVMHKIDRSARNLKDWADLGNLIDQGIEVHFAHESLDMQARGGRLSADIQAVIAADYIRNLRQEAIKGLYGRLNQGLYPFGAPNGYLDTGKGKPKIPDPAKAPLVRRAFELYASNRHTFETLVAEMRKLGLTTNTGKPIARTDLTTMLNNPFYAGMMKVKGTLYNGVHEPIIPPHVFKAAQDVLNKKTNARIVRHAHTYKRAITCAQCAHSLVGEVQKGRTYYRCHTKGCPTTGIRETAVELALINCFRKINLLEVEHQMLEQELSQHTKFWNEKKESLKAAISLQLNQAAKKIERITDCYVEGGLDKESFEKRKEALFLAIKEKERELKGIEATGVAVAKRARAFLELSKSLVNTFKTAKGEEKRELALMTTSNFQANGKKLEISMVSPFSELANYCLVQSGAPERDSSRNKASKVATAETSKGKSATFVIDTLSIPDIPARKPFNREQLKSLLAEIMGAIRKLPEDNPLNRYGNLNDDIRS